MFDLERLLKDIKLSQKELSVLLRKDPSAITRVKKGYMAFPEEWKQVIKERFKINLSDYELEESSMSQVRESNAVYVKQAPKINHDPDGKDIPFYDIEVFATISSAMSDVVALRPDTFIRIPMFSQGQFAVQVTGHSMKPYISHSDWVVIRQITDRSEIIYGEPYLIVTKADNLKTVKFLKPGDSEDTFWLVPYNIEQFEPQEIKKSSVLELYRVIGVFKTV